MRTDIDSIFGAASLGASDRSNLMPLPPVYSDPIATLQPKATSMRQRQRGPMPPIAGGRLAPVPPIGAPPPRIGLPPMPPTWSGGGGGDGISPPIYGDPDTIPAKIAPGETILPAPGSRGRTFVDENGILHAAGGADSTFTASLGGGRRRGRGGRGDFQPPDSGPPSWMGGNGDNLWGELLKEYGNVGDAFDTTSYDKAAETEYGNILTSSEQAANAAGADYAARARQSGGNAMGAGIVKAQGVVAGRSQVADFKMKQMQYDIEQKEKAKQLAAQMSSQLGDLRLGYLRNLTGYKQTELEAASRRWISTNETNTQRDLAGNSLGEQRREFDLLHGTGNTNINDFYGGSGVRTTRRPGGTEYGGIGLSGYLPNYMPPNMWGH